MPRRRPVPQALAGGYIAGGSFAASLGLLVTGLFLHELDTPGPEDLYRPPPPQAGPLADGDPSSGSPLAGR